MSKVEEVARAIAREAGTNYENGDFWLPYARAAIGAMREPQVEMIAAFWRQKNTGTQEMDSTGDKRSDYDAWRAAIDAALREEGR